MWISCQIGKIRASSVKAAQNCKKSTCKTRKSATNCASPFLLWPSAWMHQDATWYGCRFQPRGLCDRWGSSTPPQKGGGAPKFSVHKLIYCDQTAGWIKMAFGTEVGLNPGDFLFDGDPASPRKKGTPTSLNFWPMSIVAKRLDG